MYRSHLSASSEHEYLEFVIVTVLVTITYLAFEGEEVLSHVLHYSYSVGVPSGSVSKGTARVQPEPVSSKYPQTGQNTGTKPCCKLCVKPLF